MNVFVLSQNPVEKVGLFASPPASSQDVALVYLDKRNEYTVLQNGNSLTKSELRWGKFQTVYEVDVRGRTLEITNEFKSSDPLDKFNITVEFVYSVVDPIQMVRRSEEVIEETIIRMLLRSINQLSQKHTVEEKFELEGQIENLIQSTEFGTRMNELGFQVYEIRYVKIDISEEAESRLRDLRLKRQEVEDEKAQIKYNEEIEKVRIESNAAINEKTRQYFEEELRSGNTFAAKLKAAKSPEEMAEIIAGEKDQEKKGLQEALEMMTTLKKQGLSVEDIYEFYQSFNQPAMSSFGAGNDTKSLKDKLSKKLASHDKG